MKYAISEIGLESFQSLRKSISFSSERLDEANTALKNDIGKIENGLGSYYDSIMELLDKSNQAFQSGQKAADVLQKDLSQLIDTITALLNFDGNGMALPSGNDTFSQKIGATGAYSTSLNQTAHKDRNKEFRDNLKISRFENSTKALQQIENMTIDELNKYAVHENLAKYADFSGLDCRVAKEMVRSLYATRQKFPNLEFKMGFIGSIKGRNEHVVKTASLKLLLYYSNKYAQDNPGCSIDEIRKYAKQRTNRQLSKLVPKKGTIAQSISSDVITKDTPMDDVILIEAASGISVNEQIGGDYGNFWLLKTQEVNSGHKPLGCDTPKATIDHELGHQIAHKVGAETDSYIKAEFVKFMKLPKEHRVQVLSEYAGEDGKIGEFIAECWSEFQNNENPRDMALKISNRIIELYNSGIGSKGSLERSIF